MGSTERSPAALIVDPHLQRLWARARVRLEATGGALVGAFTLRGPSEDERRAIELLLGQRRRGRDVQVRLEELDRALRGSRMGIGLLGLLVLEAPLRDRRGEAARLEAAVEEAIEHATRSPLGGEPWFGEWLREAERDGLLTRLAKSGQADHVATAVRVLERLPEDGIPLPILAGSVTNDAKALDRGPLATLTLRALALRAGRPRPARSEERRALWEAFGVVMDDLASQVLVLNLAVSPTTPLGQWLAIATRDGVPFRITLHQLMTYRLQPRPSVVRICENPAILRAAAARFGAQAGAIVCTEGQPSVAFARLAQLLVRAGCELWTHGDFDWPGVRMVAALLRRHGARPWRSTSDDYREAVAAAELDELQPLSDEPAPTPWDPALGEAMRETGRIVFEEMVIDSLLSDLDPRQPRVEQAIAATVAQLASLGRCAHKVYLDAHGSPADKLSTSAFLELLWYERSSRLGERAAQLQAVAIDGDDRSGRTLEVMRGGCAWISGAELRDGALLGAPDLLEREDIPSNLGEFGYRPVSVRAASAIADSTSRTIKAEYAIELCAQADLLGRAQGRRPTTAKIFDHNADAHIVDLGPYWPEYEERRARVLRLVGDAERTQPGWKAECHLCHWQARCHEDLLRADDLTLIPGIGDAHRESLGSVGVATRLELAGADPARVAGARGVGERRAESWIRQARVHVDRRPLFLDAWERPSAEVEVAYDIEDFTPRPFVYLHGLLIRRRDARRRGGAGFTDADFGSFEPVYAGPTESEESTWGRFLGKVEELDALGGYVVYVYSHHERTVLGRLAGKYGASRALESFLGRFVDLHEVVRRTVVLPTESTGLKAVARYIGFDWRDDDPGGAESMAWWAAYLEDPVANRAARDRVLAYNEDDLRATAAIVDWLAERTTPSANRG